MPLGALLCTNDTTPYEKIFYKNKKFYKKMLISIILWKRKILWEKIYERENLKRVLFCFVHGSISGCSGRNPAHIGKLEKVC